MRALSVVVALSVSSLVLAGCLGGDDGRSGGADPVVERAGLSEVRFEVLPGVSVWIDASSDDTRLHTRLFLPDRASDPEWRAPTILVMSPYFGNDAREDEMDASSAPSYYRYRWLIDNFVPRGYAVAFSDVRGTGDSGGCLEQTAELQRQDGHDVVEWLAAEEWSNGKVGMFGKSYDAETQQGTAITTPPHLTTIVPVASVSGQYEWNFYDGVPFTLHTLVGNLAYMAGDGLQPPTTTEGVIQYPTRVGCHPMMLAQAAHRDGDWDEYWRVREFRPHVDAIEASVLYVHGLQDWNVRHVAIRDWFDRIPSEKRAIFGQWAHDYPEENRWERDWSRQDWRETVHKWYDHWLLGLDNGIMEDLPPVQIQDSAGVWRSEPTYPPTDATESVFHLADGAMTHNDTDIPSPLLFRENDEAFLRAQGIPVEDQDSGAAATRLVFVSEPLAETLHVSGWPLLDMVVTLSDGLYPDPDELIDAHFAANLYRIGPDGTETWYNAGYLSARHRDGVDRPADVREDVAIEYTLRFHPEDTVLENGTRLKLVLSGSDRQTEVEGSFFAAALSDGALRLPVIEREWEAVTLDVPLGDPIDS